MQRPLCMVARALFANCCPRPDPARPPDSQPASADAHPTLHSSTSCCCCCAAVRSMGCFCKKKVLQAAYYIQTAEQWREGSLLTPQGIHSFLLLVSCNNSLDGTTKWLIWLRVYVSMFLPKRIIFLSTIPLQVRIQGCVMSCFLIWEQMDSNVNTTVVCMYFINLIS